MKHPTHTQYKDSTALEDAWCFLDAPNPWTGQRCPCHVIAVQLLSADKSIPMNLLHQSRIYYDYFYNKNK